MSLKSRARTPSASQKTQKSQQTEESQETSSKSEQSGKIDKTDKDYDIWIQRVSSENYPKEEPVEEDKWYWTLTILFIVFILFSLAVVVIFSINQCEHFISWTEDSGGTVEYSYIFVIVFAILTMVLIVYYVMYRRNHHLEFLLAQNEYFFGQAVRQHMNKEITKEELKKRLETLKEEQRRILGKENASTVRNAYNELEESQQSEISAKTLLNPGAGDQ